MSPSDNLVQINGFWVDLTTVESTLIIALSSYSLISVKLVSSSTSSRLALFFTGLSKVDELAFLKAARDSLLTCPSFPEPLAAMISFAKQLTEMPIDEDGDIDVSALRSTAEERWEARRSSRRSRPFLDSAKLGPAFTDLLSPPSSQLPGTACITSMPAMSVSPFHPSTFPPIPEIPAIAIYSPESTPTRDVEIFSPRFGTTPTYPPPAQPSSIMEMSLRSKIALEVASHVTTLLSLPASSSVPTYLPLKLAGLNSVATAQLYFWLQERYEYDEDITRLFEDSVSAEVIASHIAGQFHRPPLCLILEFNASLIQVTLLFLPLRTASLPAPPLPPRPSTPLTPKSSSSLPIGISTTSTLRLVSPRRSTRSTTSPRFTPSILTPSATSSPPG